MLNHMNVYDDSFNKKKVRFASLDSKKLSRTEIIQTNTYHKNGQLCRNCGCIRIGNAMDSECKNCLIPKPKKNSLVRSKSEFLSESLENLKRTDSKNSINSTTEANIPFNNTLEFFDFENDDPNYSNLIFKTKSNPLPTKARRWSQNNYTKSPPLQSNNFQTQKIAWNCYACKKPLKAGEVAICAEHIDPIARWHPACFSCNKCKKLLVDLLYYNKDKEILCEKHFKETQSIHKKFLSNEKLNEKDNNLNPFDIKSKSNDLFYDQTLKLAKQVEKAPTIICAGCGMYIESNQYILAENSYWHTEHFICWNCDMSLGGQKYIVVNSKPHCVSCHQNMFSKNCQTCKSKIAPDLVRLTYDSLDWHATEMCFKCSCCNKNLLETHFLLKNNLLFCSMECKKKLIPTKNKNKN